MEKVLRFIALTTTFFLLRFIVTKVESTFHPILTSAFLCLLWALFLSIFGIFSLLLMIRIFKRKINTVFRISLWVIGLCGIVQIFLLTPIVLIFITALTVFLLLYYIIVSWKSLRGAQWAVLVGVLLSMSFGVVLATLSILAPDANYYLGLWLFTGVCLSFPLSLLVYVAMRFTEIIGEVRDNAKRIIQFSEEKKEQAVNQQKILQEEVSRQTIELRTYS